MDFTTIENISLQHLLPLVFRGMEESQRIQSSEIWNRDSFVFRRGEKYCVHAESGGGKSSLLSFIYGNRVDYQGTLCFDNTDVRLFSIRQWCDVRTRHIALLPQEMRLFPELTVLQNIQLKNQRTGYKTPSDIEDLLSRLGIAEKKDTVAGKLSIGQQQRVAVVRSICQPFDFIFLDEPVSHLDEKNNALAASIIEEEAARQGAAIVTTSVGNHLLLNNASFISL